MKDEKETFETIINFNIDVYNTFPDSKDKAIVALLTQLKQLHEQEITQIRSNCECKFEKQECVFINKMQSKLKDKDKEIDNYVNKYSGDEIKYKLLIEEKDKEIEKLKEQLKGR